MGLRRGTAIAVLVLLALAAGPAAAKTVTPSAVLEAQPVDATAPTHGPRQTRAHPRGVPDEHALRHGKELAAGRGPTTGGTTGPAPSAAVVGGLNQPGLGATDNSAANQGSPPDTTGAIGPTHYVEFVNSKVGVYSRTNLGLVTSRDLDAFAGRSGQDVFDPQIQWDQQGGRWLYVAVDVDSLNRNFLAFGWSKTADPSDLANGWCRFVISTDVGGQRYLEDYPKLGHDNLHLLIGTNSIRNNSFITAHVYSLPKPADGDTSCTAPSGVSMFGSPTSPLRTSDSTPVFTPVPANTADTASAGFVVAADAPYFVGSPSQIMAWHVGGSATVPSLIADGNMNVTPFAFPANVPQPGTSEVIDSSDTRLTQAVAVNDPLAGNAKAVWTQHTVDGPGGRSVVRWYELLPGSLNVRQQGTIEDASRFVFNGAISPAFNGITAATHFNTGNASTFADIRAQSRSGSTPLGQMAGSVVLGTSSAADQDFSCGGASAPCRWGDYAGASPDPLDTAAVWGSNQLNGPQTSDPAWITRNFELVDEATGYVRPRGATPLRVPLVPAYAPCASPNRNHGAPLSFGSCAPPAQVSTLLTVGTPDANGVQAQAIGSVELAVVVGDSSTPADEADVKLTASTTDVRLRSGLGDYTGQLTARVTLRLTDQASDPQTTTDEPYTFAVPCAVTASTSIGSTCSVATTADSLVPGTVPEGARSIWELGTIGLWDSNGKLFETQGVFTP